MPRHDLFSDEQIRNMLCVHTHDIFKGLRVYRKYLEINSRTYDIQESFFMKD